jgi:hypothetical protein
MVVFLGATKVQTEGLSTKISSDVVYPEEISAIKYHPLLSLCILYRVFKGASKSFN